MVRPGGALALQGVALPDPGTLAEIEAVAIIDWAKGDSDVYL